jgi:hypothetical protein
MKRISRIALSGLALLIGTSSFGALGCHHDTETKRTTVKVEGPEHEHSVTVEKKEHHD